MATWLNGDADARQAALSPNSHIVFVNDLTAVGPQVRGVTYDRDLHNIIIEWRRPAAAGLHPIVITHEIGHGTDVDLREQRWDWNTLSWSWVSHINWETDEGYASPYVMTALVTSQNAFLTRTDVTRYLD